MDALTTENLRAVPGPGEAGVGLQVPGFSDPDVGDSGHRPGVVRGVVSW